LTSHFEALKFGILTKRTDPLGNFLNFKLDLMRLHSLYSIVILPKVIEARSWTSVGFDNDVLSGEFHLGMENEMIHEGDPFLSRTTFRPTGAPTITPNPTLDPTQSAPTVFPSDYPTLYPTIAFPSFSNSPSESSFPSLSPKPTRTLIPTTFYPSLSHTSYPSMNPSSKLDDSKANGGCPTAEVLHDVILIDQFGDGWDGRELIIERLGDDLFWESTTVQFSQNSQYVLEYEVKYGNGSSKTSIVKVNNSSLPAKSRVVWEEVLPGPVLSLNPIFRGTTSNSNSSIQHACLQPGRCYRAILPGGEWDGEISWEIRQSILQSAGASNQSNKAIVNGGAPSNCTFSVPGLSEDPKMFCYSDCRLAGADPLITTTPSIAPTTPKPSWAPVTLSPSSSPITNAPVIETSVLRTTSIIRDLNPPSVSRRPSGSPSFSPTIYPSLLPSLSPSEFASVIPTEYPTTSPSFFPTTMLSFSPSQSPSKNPSFIPSDIPSDIPSVFPTLQASDFPTSIPSSLPSMDPSSSPSILPSLTPSETPIDVPTNEPTWSPTVSPTEWTEAYKTSGKPVPTINEITGTSNSSRHDDNALSDHDAEKALASKSRRSVTI
jgi:hypothetical protein